jgi:hypothetical protein
MNFLMFAFSLLFLFFFLWLVVAAFGLESLNHSPVDSLHISKAGTAYPVLTARSF